ncbi:MAG: hypothetical protein US39_C0012G0022 [Microgenomates group bacterium GW2011_GWC1_37_12b]|uniref:Uncharacterized protein n=1 Tax=Candidatus Woesebacteria bacterium GW2011_GWB1_38_8b TaxID=1618571 RepID=A0A0G0L5T6_9BACT|nr:MAG: hypothetical protein US39_C0012G0022 [Microgenomates group bacterium GW2011_GWC1_37_12b]KKQ86392.1 MAG: hypothetical protein UT10_C0026G0016 [Candidatus Woesebacteria bacterium GW2011_GWB1_38_8b]
MNKISFDIGTQLLGNDTFPRDPGSVGRFITAIASNAVVIAGIICVFMIIAGGFGMIAGAGGNNPQNAAKGRQAATAGVIGFLIIFAAYWIVQVVEIITGVTIF